MIPHQLTPRQRYLVSEVGSALTKLNDYLKEQKADFALNDEQFGWVACTFVHDDVLRVFPVPIEDTATPDRYWAGRKLGRVYHRMHNPSFYMAPVTNAQEHNRRRKLQLTLEHTFAMLLVRSEEEDANLENLVDEPSAQDPVKKGETYSLLFDKKLGTPDPLGSKPQGLDDYVEKSKQQADDETKRFKEDHKFDPNQAKKFSEQKPDYDLPDELNEYRKFEGLGGVSDDPLIIAFDKAKREEFTVGRIIVEGQGWKKSVSKLLRQDLESAVIHIRELLEY